MKPLDSRIEIDPPSKTADVCCRWGYPLLALAAFIPFAIMMFVVLRFWLLPLLFFALGFGSYLFNGRRAVGLFLFLLPLVNAFPGLMRNGYPFNYMAVVLFLLAGMVAAAFLKGEKPAIQGVFLRGYLFFLLLLHGSAFFVWLRWSNITLGAKCFLRNTPVNPAGDRLSFAAILPLITLMIFSLSPYALALLRQHRFRSQNVMRPLLAGYFLSLALALVQRFLWPELLSQGSLSVKLQQPNGGFSDFNAFGFFSGAIFFYLLVLMTRALRSKQTKSNDFLLWLLAVPVFLCGISLSGSRTSFIFVLIGLLYIFREPPIKWLEKAAAALLIIGILVLTNGPLNRRLIEMVKPVMPSGQAGLIEKLDVISNGRLSMVGNSLPMIKRQPLSGVGVGNYLFNFRFLYRGQGRYEDMPLNQYLLVLDEMGIVGLVVFLLFLALIFFATRSKDVKYLWAGYGLSFLVGNPLWLPEVAVLLWIFAALECDENKPLPVGGPFWRGTTWLLAGVFIMANILDFQSLHPVNWAQQRGTRYDYGFWYKEKNGQGRDFNWTQERSGIFLVLDRFGKSAPITVSCGAPLLQMPGLRQHVDIYWRGEWQQRLIFKKNSSETFSLRGAPLSRGFFELVVDPVFNLQSWGLGPDNRTLGVQLDDFSLYGH